MLKRLQIKNRKAINDYFCFTVSWVSNIFTFLELLLGLKFIIFFYFVNAFFMV